MTRLRNHPGQTLGAELQARELTANQLALALRVPANRITAILRGERPITAETAVRLGRFMGTGAILWMNLQAAYDVSVVEATMAAAIDREVLPPSSAPQGAD
ncbi:MAG: HigA family addiction module antidote protein [Holophagales bacterium]|nr:HigA family addiction module antidote protein [Holophagales bacterium]MYF96927.1 HigA family addiction module antidote protein [Holophagales bacterium]